MCSVGAMDRVEVLDTAKAAITGDRQDAHGDPRVTFRQIAAFWGTYLGDDISRTLTSHDVANMMVLLKVARSQQNPRHPDHGVDIAGYAALGVELVDAGPVGTGAHS